MKDTIVNRTVDNAADIMEAKIDHLTIVREIVVDKGEFARAESIAAEIMQIADAVRIMRERSGSWA